VRGTAGHVALASHYKGEPANKCLDKARGILAKEAMLEDWKLMERVISRYLEWSKTGDEGWEIQDVETRFTIRLGEDTVIGYIDLLIKDGNGLFWVVDHKFSKTARSPSILDPQTMLYQYAVQKLRGLAIEGAIYNVVRVREGGVAEKEPVKRTQLRRSSGGMAVFEREIQLQMNQMNSFHQDPMWKYRNPTDACGWDCDYYKVCLALQTGADWRRALQTSCVQRQR